MKIKEQEKEDKEGKLVGKVGDTEKALKQTRDVLDQEIKKRQTLQIEVNTYKASSKIGADLHGGLSFEQVQNRNRELENDILILQC